MKEKSFFFRRPWLKKLCLGLLSAAFWIAVWAIVARRVGSELLFPGIGETAEALLALFRTPDTFFLRTLGASFGRVILGILLGVLGGLAVGLLSHVSELMRALLSPFMTVVKATPIASFIVLALLWLDRTALPTWITFLIVLPVVSGNTEAGLSAVDRGLSEVTAVFRLSPLRKFRTLTFPTLLPYLSGALRSTLGLAWKAGIAAEVLCLPERSIGTEIYFAKTYLETPTLFAWTLTAILISVVIELLASWALHAVCRAAHVEERKEK